MTQDELRHQFKKYNLEPSLTEQKEVLDMFSNFLLMTIRNHHNEDLSSSAIGQAKLVFQMMLTKVLHLRSLINGVSFTTNDGTILNNIIDPTVIAISIRNIFETVGMFNLIYRTQKTEDEKTIVYLLWVIAGLSYRQRFETNIISKEAREKYEFEKQEIIRLTSVIEQTHLYQGLDAKNQDKIQNRIRQREYLIKFENNKVIFLAWHELSANMGIKPGLFDNMYTYFSLYTHPSNVSVFQFGEMFEDGQKPFMELTVFNLKYAIFLLSIFVSDYIVIFPKVLKSFEQIPLIEQILLDYPNFFVRGEDYSINNSWKALG